MKTSKLILFGAVATAMTAGAYAAGENTVATKSYIDSGVSQKQDIISKVANNNSAMLFPTTTGGTPQSRTINTTVGTSTSDTGLVTRGAVATELNNKQETVNGVSGSANKVVLYNSSGGLSATNNPAKGVYNSGSAYSGQTTNLVEAQHVNGAVANGFNAHLTCNNPPDCDLWDINQLDASTNAYVPQPVSGN